MNPDICLLVKKCLLKSLNSETFDDYFTQQMHNKNTRNNNHSIRLPRVKLELARQSFYFYGGKLYNALPLGMRKIDNICEFKVSLKGHFLWYFYLLTQPYVRVFHQYFRALPSVILVHFFILHYPHCVFPSVIICVPWCFIQCFR